MSEENTTNEVKLYELGFHLNPAITDDQVSSKIDEIKAVLTKNGAEIVKEGEAQSMKLAYEITKSIGGKNERFTSSTFSWVQFNLGSEGLEEIKEAIDLNDEIIRSLIVKTTDDEEHSTSKIANEDESEESEESDNSGEAKVEEPVKEEKKEEEEPVEEEKESAVEETEEKVEEEK
jgi:small subunit ribosomal protein S6